MRQTVPLLLLAALAMGSLAPATALAAEHDARLLMALSAYHEDPPAGALDFLGAERDAALEAVARDDDAMRLQRIRAISILCRDDSEAGRALALEVATEASWSVRLRIAATRALSNYQLYRPETLVALQAATRDADPGVRKVAVRGLATLDTPEARQTLTELRGRERHAAVRGVLREALLRQRPAAALPPEGRLPRGVTVRAGSEVVR